MAQKFVKATEMMKRMKKDLMDRTFPHLLTHLATATKVQVQAGLAEAAGKNNGKTPPLKLSVSKVPIPGSSEVETKFVTSETPTSDQRSNKEGAAYKDVFRRFYKDRLGSKPLMLKLLATVGVT